MIFSFRKPKSKLGVDIGTSSIKVVQLKKEEKGYLLETYGIVDVSLRKSMDSGFDAIAETARILRLLLEKSRVTTKKVVASLPNNIVFVSMIEIPEMSEKELKAAIEFEARRYVPLPLEEVTLSWSVLREPSFAKATEGKPATSQKLKILLTAVPTSVIENYLKMFKIAGLEPQALEIESLALIRSLAGSRSESFMIVDIGARNTSLSLVDKGFLRLSRNLTVGGETITAAIARGLKVSVQRAEQFKKDLGLGGELLKQIPDALRPPIDTIKSEITQLINIYESGGGSIREIIFAGLGAKLPGLVEYFSDLGPRVALGDPLKFVSHDPQVKPYLTPVALSLSVAMGLAMRE